MNVKERHRLLTGLEDSFATTSNIHLPPRGDSCMPHDPALATEQAHTPRLLADIGGTHARFAWQPRADAAVEDVRVYRCAEAPTLESAIRSDLAQRGRPVPPLAAIGIANPVFGDRVAMTNHHWSFSIEALRAALGFERLVVMNDFEALARSLPLLEPDETVQLCGPAGPAAGAVALIGPGTGLGVAGLVPHEGRWLPIVGEGGHATLAPTTPREAAVCLALQRRFGHASAERAVSGPGLVSVHEALAELDGAVPEPGLTAQAIAARGDDARAREALDLFFAFLGTTAGNLALTFGARRGVYLGGGILPQLRAQLEGSAFRARFLDKGRFRSYLEGVPVHLVTTDRHPALRGAAQAL